MDRCGDSSDGLATIQRCEQVAVRESLDQAMREHNQRLTPTQEAVIEQKETPADACENNCGSDRQEHVTPSTSVSLSEEDDESLVQEMLFGSKEPETQENGADDRSVSTANLMNLLQLQNRKCSISGMPLNTKTMALDHVVPVSKDGQDTIDNVTWIHASINRMKGTMSLKRFVTLCRKVARWNRC